MKAMAAIVLILCGCVTGQSAYERQWETERASLITKVVQPKCPATRGAVLCGTISEGLLKGSTEFNNSYCVPHQMKDAECVDAFNKMIFARLAERYPSADVAALKLTCDAHPMECDISKGGFLYIELELMESHDDAIFALLRKKRAQIQADADADALQQRQAWGRALQAAGKSMQESTRQQQSIHCTSNSYSGTTYTDCH